VAHSGQSKLAHQLGPKFIFNFGSPRMLLGFKL
jgi:hypothetical protein